MQKFSIRRPRLSTVLLSLALVFMAARLLCHFGNVCIVSEGPYVPFYSLLMLFGIFLRLTEKPSQNKEPE